ncbi:MAG TPA: hydrogenase maturation protease [Terriglobales bacterium]|nr:hydrogenase maturation protease [Terriglobales bacterium]
MKKVLIAGVGNVLLGDDGVGPFVTRLLASRYEFESGVEIEDLGTPALDFIDNLLGLDALIVVDSVENGKPAGSVTLYRKPHLVRHAPGVRMDPHSPAMSESIMAADLIGTGPREVLLIGISGGSYEAGCDLSAPVKASVEAAIREVIRELDRLRIPHHLNENAGSPAIWWSDATPAVTTAG